MIDYNSILPSLYGIFKSNYIYILIIYTEFNIIHDTHSHFSVLLITMHSAQEPPELTGLALHDAVVAASWP